MGNLPQLSGVNIRTGRGPRQRMARSEGPCTYAELCRRQCLQPGRATLWIPIMG